MNTFFRLFGDLRVLGVDVSYGLYPPPPLRRFLAMLAAHAVVVQHWKPSDTVTDTLNALKTGALYVENAFQVITGHDSGRGIEDAFSHAGLEYAKNIEAYWRGTLARKIAKYAYEFDPKEISTP